MDEVSVLANHFILLWLTSVTDIPLLCCFNWKVIKWSGLNGKKNYTLILFESTHIYRIYILTKEKLVRTRCSCGWRSAGHLPMRTEESKGAWLRERGGMVTSRKDRKCTDSSSAGRAGIFYCSSWRMVCWLPVPPPTGVENVRHISQHSHRNISIEVIHSLSSLCLVAFSCNESTCDLRSFRKQFYILLVYRVLQSYHSGSYVLCKQPVPQQHGGCISIHTLTGK